MPATRDFAVVGGGIVGCALAAFLAEGGANVTLYEREAIAAGASGRNSGVVQDPLDPELTALYEESLGHYRDARGLRPARAPVRPAADRRRAVRARGRRADRGPATAGAGARSPACSRAGSTPAARPARGRRTRVGATRATRGSEDRASAATARRAARGSSPPARGPTSWSPLPIAPVWGVVVDVELPDAPIHVLEEAGIDALTSEDVPDVLFSAVTARGISAIGSTFMPDQPDPEALAPEILANARRFLADLGSVRGLRACARPGSADGRPMLGRIAEELYVASGHGAWGITLGPASARLVADLALGRPVEIPPALDVRRFSARSSS